MIRLSKALSEIGTNSEADLLTAIVDARIVLESIAGGGHPAESEINSALAGLESMELLIQPLAAKHDWVILHEGGGIYFNVNEEAVPYERHDEIGAALRTLDEYPNDSIVIVLPGSPLARKLASELAALQERDRKQV